MVASQRRRSHLSLASAFASAASRYWLEIFPLVVRELRHWHEQARQIPDPVLRRLALLTQRIERGNYEGAAAYAALVPHAYRARVVRAVVAFQTTYDYVDTLSEQPSHDPVANGRQLHRALLSSLDPDSEHIDYYEHSHSCRDNGYISHLVQTCRDALAALPSYADVAQPALRAASTIVAYQALNHEQAGDGPRALARWGAAVAPPGSGLRWWEAAAGGASEGMKLAINIAAMLISFLALIALANGILGGIHNHIGIAWFPSSLQQIFGTLFAPVAWVIGIPWRDCTAIGNLLGTRMVLNELVAFSMLGPQRAALDPRSFTIATFALCGFANLSSIGIQLGGIGALAPNKRGELARLGIRAMLAGTMANLMSASIAGMLL